MTTTDTSLSQQQLARAEALDRARAVLVGRTTVGLFGQGASVVTKVEFPHEVTGLARYVIDGTDLFNTENADGAVAE